MKKDTSKMLEELKKSFDFNHFYNKNSSYVLHASLSQYLNELLCKHDIKKAEAIKRSELNDIYAYQIFSGIRVPERRKLLALAVGMRLSLDEVQSLLKCASYAQLYVKNTFDCIVIFGICKGLSVFQINEILYDYGMETMG